MDLAQPRHCEQGLQQTKGYAVQKHLQRMPPFRVHLPTQIPEATQRLFHPKLLESSDDYFFWN